MESNKLWTHMKLILSPVMILEGFKVQGKWKRRQKSAESVIDFVPWKNTQICFRNCQDVLSPFFKSTASGEKSRQIACCDLLIFWFDLLLWILESSKLTKFEFWLGGPWRDFSFSLYPNILCHSRTLKENVGTFAIAQSQNFSADFAVKLCLFQ